MILYVLYLLKVITCIKWYPTSGPSNITLDRFYCNNELEIDEELTMMQVIMLV